MRNRREDGEVHFPEDWETLSAAGKRRFRLTRGVFLRIMKSLEEKDQYFTQRKDCPGREGLSMLQKSKAAIHMLSYVSSADYIDEYVRIGESKRFFAWSDSVVESYRALGRISCVVPLMRI